jgi:CRP-like cAMP-binding protein
LPPKHIQKEFFLTLQSNLLIISNSKEVIEMELDNQTVLTLMKVPLFSALSVEDFKSVAEKLSIKCFEKGDYMVRQGELGDYFYVIKSGEADVVLEDEQKKVAHLKEGDFFGEIALLVGVERTASVIATTDVEAITMNKKGFNELLKENPSVAANLSKTLVFRLSKMAEEM